ncbi:hypothetical protein EVAR_103116_1 [Eumeta japonica]|uniref:Uncharacterized protein n=1 Tax=Eumeta variegata TaxID=151549 RepID=A0A4C1X1A0_EUMVA|nr:hypothetical protein EVAR_103116_1 [Eumeta japonica]
MQVNLRYESIKDSYAIAPRCSPLGSSTKMWRLDRTKVMTGIEVMNDTWTRIESRNKNGIDSVAYVGHSPNLTRVYISGNTMAGLWRPRYNLFTVGNFSNERSAGLFRSTRDACHCLGSCTRRVTGQDEGRVRAAPCRVVSGGHGLNFARAISARPFRRRHMFSLKPVPKTRSRRENDKAPNAVPKCCFISAPNNNSERAHVAAPSRGGSNSAVY